MTQQSAISIQTQAWVYPGPPACSAMQEVSDGRHIDVIKPQFFSLQDNGNLVLIMASDQCNGYSPANVALIRAHSSSQYLTIPGSIAGIQALANNPALLSAYTNTLVTFLEAAQFTGGVELDIEGFGAWTVPQYTAYKNVVSKLGSALHSNNFKLMLDGPVIMNATYQNYYPNFKYEDFRSLPADYLVAMCYDLDYDTGIGTAIASLQNITDCCNWMKSKVIDKSRIVIGISSYGYLWKTSERVPVNQTYQQMTQMPGFASAERDPSSEEMMWSQDGISYDYSDSVTLQRKLQAVQNCGITNASIWHLGGNLWPTVVSVPPPLPPSPPDPMLAAFTAKYPGFDQWYSRHFDNLGSYTP